MKFRVAPARRWLRTCDIPSEGRGTDSPTRDGDLPRVVRDGLWPGRICRLRARLFSLSPPGGWVSDRPHPSCTVGTTQTAGALSRGYPRDCKSHRPPFFALPGLLVAARWTDGAEAVRVRNSPRAQPS